MQVYGIYAGSRFPPISWPPNSMKLVVNDEAYTSDDYYPALVLDFDINADARRFEYAGIMQIPNGVQSAILVNASILIGLGYGPIDGFPYLKIFNRLSLFDIKNYSEWDAAPDDITDGGLPLVAGGEDYSFQAAAWLSENKFFVATWKPYGSYEKTNIFIFDTTGGTLTDVSVEILSGQLPAATPPWFFAQSQIEEYTVDFDEKLLIVTLKAANLNFDQGFAVVSINFETSTVAKIDFYENEIQSILGHVNRSYHAVLDFQNSLSELHSNHSIVVGKVFNSFDYTHGVGFARVSGRDIKEGVVVYKNPIISGSIDPTESYGFVIKDMEPPYIDYEPEVDPNRLASGTSATVPELIESTFENVFGSGTTRGYTTFFIFGTLPD